MELHRPRPTSLSQVEGRYRSRCAICGDPIMYRQQVVHLYGEQFHKDCAFYRPLRHRTPRVRGARPG